MIDLLLYTGMMCADADALMLRIQANKSELSPKVKVELVETVKESEPECSTGTQTTEGTGLKTPSISGVNL